MQLRSLLLVAVLALTALFAVINWHAVMAPTTLSLLFATVEAPLGLILLALAAAIALLFLVFIVYLETSALLETRRHGKALESQRQLADQAEASRFTELRAFLDSRLTALSSEHQVARDAMLARLERSETALRESVEQAGNTLSTYIGELEDRLEHRLPPRDDR